MSSTSTYNPTKGGEQQGLLTGTSKNNSADIRNKKTQKMHFKRFDHVFFVFPYDCNYPCVTNEDLANMLAEHMLIWNMVMFFMFTPQVLLPFSSLSPETQPTLLNKLLNPNLN